MTAETMPELTALNLIAAAHLENNIVQAKNGDTCYYTPQPDHDPLYHDPAQMRRAVSLDTFDACNAGYNHMYKRALAAEAERDDLLAEVERLRGLVKLAGMVIGG